MKTKGEAPKITALVLHGDIPHNFRIVNTGIKILNFPFLLQHPRFHFWEGSKKDIAYYPGSAEGEA
jgi:hypothetical protein